MEITTKRPPGSRIGAMSFIALWLAGCTASDPAPAPPDASPVSGAGDLEEAPFVALPRPRSAAFAPPLELVAQMRASAPPRVFEPEQAFYLAIHRRELGRRWFASAFMRQLLPGGVDQGAATSLGTRVVSFRIQNGKLFVFDVDSRKHTSDTFGLDEIVVDAYPIVDPAKVGAPASLKDYVLVDPAAGLDRYGVVGDGFGSGRVGFAPFTVELKFSQHFRAIKDGATFEQAFTGYSPWWRMDADPIEANRFRASGVVALALRRYGEGEGYTPTPLPEVPHFIPAPARLVPNQARVARVAGKWNVHPGMKPIEWSISPLALAAQERAPLAGLGVDLVGAITAGIEGWNAAFGFPVLRAVVADAGDSFADDDRNYFIYDVDPAIGYAHAHARYNPETGEIRGASIYFNDVFVRDAVDLYAFADADVGSGQAKATEIAAPAVTRPPRLVWEPFPEQPLCRLPRLPTHARAPIGPVPDTASPKAKIERLITEVVAHEIGHTLGLQHNFKGSLQPPSSSVMDYLSDNLALAAEIPGPYDVAAVRYLYGLAPALPAQPFCTGDQVGLDPTCELFDQGADPLRDFWRPYYWYYAERFLETGAASAGRGADFAQDYLAGFARRSPSAPDRLAAFAIATAPIRAPLPPERVSGPPEIHAAGTNFLVQRLVHRLVPDPSAAADDGADQPPLDPAVTRGLLRELEGNLLDVDRLRDFSTRRQCVDALKWLQQLPAYEVLRRARTTLVPAAGVDPGGDPALLEDLRARIDRAVSPYFDR